MVSNPSFAQLPMAGNHLRITSVDIPVLMPRCSLDPSVRTPYLKSGHVPGYYFLGRYGVEHAAGLHEPASPVE